ncbi:MAG: thiamine pyrophosphate-dependent dehydrogenase E1 component subunit alpha [Candidatus Humimicrobiaceae bacterium]
MSENEALKAYELMLRSRSLDEFCEKLESEGVWVPQFHSSIGQEALSVGAAIDLHQSDYLIYTHRGYGSLLTKGVSLESIMKDMFIRKGGTNEGFGSVMHTVAPDKGIIGREGVFGTRFTIAAGLGISMKIRNRNDVVVCPYGEAVASRGLFYEALNMCVLWKLPVIFVGEHNGFTVNTRTENAYATGDLSSMWKGFDIPVRKIDGNDFNIVRSSINEAVERARQGKGPSIVEGVTYRISAHIPGEDHLAYRTEEEIKEWQKKDPIEREKRDLLNYGTLTEGKDKIMRESLKKEVEEAYKAAINSPLPTEEEMYDWIYYRKMSNTLPV